MIDNSNHVKSVIQYAVDNAMKEIGKTGVGEVKSNAPVLTGTLRKSYTFVYKEDEETTFIGTNVNYAEALEFKPISAGGRPHLRRSLENQKDNFIKIMENSLKELK